MDSSDKAVKGESINKLTTEDINDVDIGEIIESAVEHGLVKVDKDNEKNTPNNKKNNAYYFLTQQSHEIKNQ